MYTPYVLKLPQGISLEQMRKHLSPLSSTVPPGKSQMGLGDFSMDLPAESTINKDTTTGEPLDTWIPDASQVRVRGCGRSWSITCLWRATLLSCCMTALVVVGVVAYELHAQTEYPEQVEVSERPLDASDQGNHSGTPTASPPSTQPQRAHECFLDVNDLNKYSVQHSTTLTQNSAHTVKELGSVTCAGGYTIGKHAQPSVSCAANGGTFLFKGCEVKPTCSNF